MTIDATHIIIVSGIEVRRQFVGVGFRYVRKPIVPCSGASVRHLIENVVFNWCREFSDVVTIMCEGGVVRLFVAKDNDVWHVVEVLSSREVLRRKDCFVLQHLQNGILAELHLCSRDVKEEEPTGRINCVCQVITFTNHENLSFQREPHFPP